MSFPAALAYYSIRRKQEYIYKTNHIPEIIGASQLIADAFHYFTHSPRFVHAGESFSLPWAIDKLRQDTIDGILVYVGGGNLMIVYANKQTALAHNRIFSKTLLDTAHTLTPLCAVVDIDLEQDNYAADYAALMQEVNRVKLSAPPLTATQTLPFTATDRITGMPFAGDTMPFVTDEALAKQQKYAQILQSGNRIDTNMLLNERHADTMLAVVYADGNNIGKKIETALQGKIRYAACITALRNISTQIHTHLVDEGLAAIDRKLQQLSAQNPSKKHLYNRQRIIGGGDEVTFICSAACAAQLTKTYLDTVNRDGYTASAGIALFFGGLPFYRAYKIAEAACENAKERAKHYMETAGHPHAEASFIDFEHIQGHAGDTLENMRAQYVARTARPYCVTVFENGKNITDAVCHENAIPQFDTLIALANALPLPHSVVQEFGLSALGSLTEAKMMLERLCTGHNIDRKKIMSLAPISLLYRMLYDITEVYELWFTQEVQ